jgi:hypothetical protein
MCSNPPVRMRSSSCTGGHPRQGEAPSVVLLAPFSTHSAREGLKKIEHEYSFKTELTATWAVRPLALSQYNNQPALVLENPVVSLSIAPFRGRWK